MSHVVACPIVFILFYKQDWLRGVFKRMKNDRLIVLLLIWVLFPNFLGRLMSDQF